MDNHANIFLGQTDKEFCLRKLILSSLETVPECTSEVLQGVKWLVGKGMATGAEDGLAGSSPEKGKPSSMTMTLRAKCNGGLAWAIRQKMKQT